MKCPNCHNQLNEDQLYCEKCGTEIKLVPEFESHVEHTISYHLNNVVDVISGRDEKKKPRRQKSYFRYLLVIIVFTILLVFGIGYMYINYSVDLQYSYAMEALRLGDYETAVSRMERVISLEEDHDLFTLQLAEIYIEMGEYEKSLEILYSLIEKEQIDEYIYKQSYMTIIKLLSENQEYIEIAEFLALTSDEEFDTIYSEYKIFPVKFSRTGGEYELPVPLKLSSEGKGNIYYTLDGSIPDETSLVYSETIYLYEGVHQVNAIYVNEYGVVSEVFIEEYSILEGKAFPPEIHPKSGYYSYPIAITAEYQPDATCYYTLDGTVPTTQSFVFTGIIYLEEGSTNLSFIVVQEDGTTSEVENVSYEIEIDAEYSITDAKKLLREDRIEQGVILNEQGEILGDESKIYVYESLHPISIETGIDCYLFAEVERFIDGTQQRTGRYYAVDYNTGEVYELQYSNSFYIMNS